mgnify:CR=1 FL=1
MKVVIKDTKYYNMNANIISTILDKDGKAIFILALGDGKIIQEPIDMVASTSFVDDTVEGLLRSINAKLDRLM